MPAARVMTVVLAAILVPCSAPADAADVSPALRARAEAVCKDDALRLCADAIPDEPAILACMRPKRAFLTPPCRKVFDQVMQDVQS